MIKVTLNNSILNTLMRIESRKTLLSQVHLPLIVSNRLRKNTKKKSSYASNHIEGNPLTEDQVSEVIDSDSRHFLKPEQEIRNYYLAINVLEEELKKRTPFSTDLILKTQKNIVKGASKEKIGIRGQMPPGYLFAVYDEKTGNPEYIPPEHKDIAPLLDELVNYINNSDDHPIIKAAVAHYQLVTIHPFEDGNGRTARLMSGYILDYYDYGFNQIGTIDEYFAYDIDEYYQSLQMNLPVSYYQGRNNPPHLEIWIEYFLRMMDLFTEKVMTTVKMENELEINEPSLSTLNKKEHEFFDYLIKHKVEVIRPIDYAQIFKVSNKTITNWCAKLSKVGLLQPVLVKERITSYKLSLKK